MTIAIILAVQVGQGEFKTVYITTVLLFSIPIMLLMGLRSWYTLPFAMLAELPALPLFGGRALSLSEMSVSMFSGLMVLAVIQGRSKFQVKWRDWWPMLIYGGWVILIAVINGGGFALLGSAVMGGRRYLTVIIALVGMAMLSQITIREKEAKKVCFLISASLALTGVYLAVTSLIGRQGVQSAYAFYSWQQSLSLISLGSIMLMFARYSPMRIAQKPLYIILFVVMMLICIYSGKRMAFAACCLIPVAACFWHRQVIFAIAAVLMGILVISGAVMTQNYVTSIPQSLQRVLSFIPADWDWEVDQSTSDIFRGTLNRWAMKRVNEDPLIGLGVTMTMEDHNLMRDDEFIRQIKDPDDDVQAFPHIAGQNWHSTWLGLSASFGIPAAIAWIIVQLFVLRRSWTIGHTHDLQVWSSTLMAMIFFFMVYGVMRSISSGDVAILAMGGGLYLGLMSAVRNGLKDQRWELQQEQLRLDLEQGNSETARA